MKVTITIPPELLPMLEQQRPRTLTTTGFCALLVEQGLTEGCRLGAYPVGAAGTPQVQAVQSVQAVQISTPQEPSQPEEAVKPKRGKFSGTREDIPVPLQKHEELIFEFFGCKRGSKTKTAWSLLMTGLTRIRDKYGDDVVHEQLMTAVNGKFHSITLKNYEEFGKAKPKPAWQQQEPETKHPAFRPASEVIAESDRLAQQNLEHLRRKQEEAEMTTTLTDLF